MPAGTKTAGASKRAPRRIEGERYVRVTRPRIRRAAVLRECRDVARSDRLARSRREARDRHVLRRRDPPRLGRCRRLPERRFPHLRRRPRNLRPARICRAAEVRRHDHVVARRARCRHFGIGRRTNGVGALSRLHRQRIERRALTHEDGGDADPPAHWGAMAFPPQPCVVQLRKTGEPMTAAQMSAPGRTRSEILRRNRELYDNTDSAVWELAIYRGQHGGQRFINLGGETMLRRILSAAEQSEIARILDMGAGNGSVSAWFAEATGAEVTAIEINPRQAERIRSAAERVRRGGIVTVERDAAAARFSRPFDLVMSLDTLMLTPDWPGFLASARRAMAPHALFSASTILDADLTPAETAYFAAEDGMISLPRWAEARDCLRDAGLCRIECSDMTDVAVAAIERLDRALDHYRDDITQELGAASFHQWTDANREYLQAFAQRRLNYVLIHARVT